MPHNDVSKIILDRIHEKNLKPRARFGFVVWKKMYWLTIVLSVVLAILSLAVIVYLLNYSNIDLDGINMVVYFQSLPYFWFILLAIFLIFGGYLYRKTLLGYRHRFVAITAVILLIVIVFGLFGFWTGIGQKTESMIVSGVPFYTNHLYNKEKIWNQPENGFLAGEIKSILNEGFVLVDLQGNEWQVNYREAFIRKMIIIKEGEKIKIIGKQVGNRLFDAQDIRPWMGMMKRSGTMR